jgi:hypothetical protein
MGQNILFICGSLNQTTMMHQIARHLPEHHPYFTPYYADGLLGLAGRKGWLNNSILGGRHRRNTEAYLVKEQLPVDEGGRTRPYDLVVTGTDLLIQKNIHGQRLVLVQEGITEPEGLVYSLVRALKLPRFLANTAATGLSDAYARFCVASPGYRDLFIRKGVRPEKIVVTGIPNFDHLESFRQNDFPYHDFILAATASRRETLHLDNRIQYIQKARRVAGDRQLIFKLHPNENVARARQEIQMHTPDALIYSDGDIRPMIANCAALVAQHSSVIYFALALGKEVHADADLSVLRRLMPIQNGGASARQIAEVCRKVMVGATDQKAESIGRLPRQARQKAPDSA